MAKSAGTELIKGLWEANPVLRLLLGLCPTLAVTTSAENGIGMGLATTFVLLCSNILVSLLRSVIPSRVRIPAFIVIIATFVTVVDLMMAGFFYDLHKSLGIFIPLIVVNCVILGRAETFASRNRVFLSVLDGVGMGVGFTLTLFVLGAIRELLGAGTILGIGLTGGTLAPVILFVLPPGAFLTLGFLVAGMNRLSKASA